MKCRQFLSIAASIIVLALATAAVAQPPETAEGGPSQPEAGERRGPPSPEGMVEHAMRFDADGDGKLDRAELTKFAEELHAMRAKAGAGGKGGPGGKGGGKGKAGGKGGRPKGQGGQKGGRGPGGGGPPAGGDGPETPPQPE